MREKNRSILLEKGRIEKKKNLKEEIAAYLVSFLIGRMRSVTGSHYLCRFKTGPNSSFEYFLFCSSKHEYLDLIRGKSIVATPVHCSLKDTNK